LQGSCGRASLYGVEELGKQLVFTAPFSGNQRCNSAVGVEGPMLMKLVYSMTRKYLVSPVMEAARLSGGGHVMAAWEAKMSTFPTSLSVGGEEAVVSKHNPRKATPWGRRDPRYGSLGKRRDRKLTLSVASSPRRTCVCAYKPPTQCGYAGQYTRSSVRFMLAENSLRRRNTRMYHPASNSRRHVCVDHVSNISSAREAYISSGGDASETIIIHQHNTPLQHTRTTATPSASSIATHSPQR
jgi:hypothetical protein